MSAEKDDAITRAVRALRIEDPLARRQWPDVALPHDGRNVVGHAAHGQRYSGLEGRCIGPEERQREAHARSEVVDRFGRGDFEYRKPGRVSTHSENSYSFEGRASLKRNDVALTVFIYLGVLVFCAGLLHKFLT